MRLLRVALIAALLVSGFAHAEYSLGPFSRLSKYAEGTLWNGYFATTIERGFKLQAIVPEVHDNGILGRQEFAGFVSLDVNGDALFTHFAQPEDGTKTLYCDDFRAVVAKEWQGWHQEIELAHGYPFVWLRAKAANPPPEGITWLIGGFSWVNKTVPGECQLVAEGGTAPTEAQIGDGLAAPLPAGKRLGNPLVILRRPNEAWQLALVFPESPSVISVKQDNILIRVPQADGNAAPFALAILPASLTWADVAKLTPVAVTRPASRKVGFGMAAGRPTVSFETAFEPLAPSAKRSPAPLIAIPPTLADRAPAGSTKLPTLWGDIALCPGERFTATLDPVPRIDEVAPPVVQMKPEWQARMNDYTTAICDHLRPEGGFTSSLGRPFYDGLTLAGLMSARPYLNPDVKKRCDEAVKRTLDLWWEGLRQDGETGIWNFPEPPPGKPVIDYPEITSTLLWPTVQYCATVDPEYVKGIASKLEKLGPSLARAYDWSGAAYAYPGPEFNHIIVESIVGGFVTWCSMYQLEKRLGHTKQAEEYAARAAYAREAMKLLRWKTSYPAGGIVSEIKPDNLKIGIAEAWDYTMYTWFSFVPASELPKEDIYGVWRCLDSEKWWLYSEKSHQRCYDYAHSMAIARTFGTKALADKLPAFDNRPYAYDSFDPTPVYTLMAYPWLAEEE